MRIKSAFKFKMIDLFSDGHTTTIDVLRPAISAIFSRLLSPLRSVEWKRSVRLLSLTRGKQWEGRTNSLGTTQGDCHFQQRASVMAVPTVRGLSSISHLFHWNMFRSGRPTFLFFYFLFTLFSATWPQGTKPSVDGVDRDLISARIFNSGPTGQDKLLKKFDR